MDAGDGDMHLVLEHGEGDSKEDLALTLTDLLDDTIAACHGTADNGDTVALTDFVSGLAIDNLEIITLDDGLETLHLGIADLHRVAMLITIGIEAVAGRWLRALFHEALRSFFTLSLDSWIKMKWCRSLRSARSSSMAS